MNSRPTRNYSPKRVRYLVENWETLQEKKGVFAYPLQLLCELIDVERALPRLPHVERQAVLLCGQAGLTVRTAGVLVDADWSLMARRYRQGLERLTTYMNGER